MATLKLSAPLCEVCSQEPAVSLSYLGDHWRLAGWCTSSRERYYVMLHGGPSGHDGWLDSPKARKDWREHLRWKVWFDPADFEAAVARLNAALEGVA